MSNREIEKQRGEGNKLQRTRNEREDKRGRQPGWNVNGQGERQHQDFGTILPAGQPTSPLYHVLRCTYTLTPTSPPRLEQCRHILSAYTDRLTRHLPHCALIFRQQLNLSQQKAFLIQKLVILCPTLEKRGQKPQQPPPILDQNPPYVITLIRIGNEHLEHVKRLVLDHLAVVLEEIHGQLEVIPAGDIGGHDDVVAAVKEDLAEEFDRLPLCDVGGGVEKDRVVVVGEEEVKVRCEVLRG